MRYGGPITGAIIVATLVYIVLRLMGEQRARRKVVGTRAPRVPTDLNALFATSERIGSLHLASGRIVACDPIVFHDEPAFEREVAPGDYPVDIVIAKQRVAAVRVTFRPGTPARFEAAGNYGVDAGLGCFMDERAAALLGTAFERADYFETVLAPELGDRDWVDHRPVAEQPDNVVIVHSGWGDGIYTSYWGLDEHDVPLCLVTDFNVV